MRRLGSARGLALPELMVAVGIFSLFAIAFYSLSNFVGRAKADNMVHTRLMNDARRAMDKIVWGVGVGGERDGLAEASTYTINPDGLDYVLQDGLIRRIEVDGAAEEIDFSRQGGGDAVIYAPPANGQTFSTELTFTQLLPRVVEVELVLGHRYAGRWYYATLATQISLRN